MKYTTALGSRWSTTAHTTTNHKQAAATEGSMEGCMSQARKEGVCVTHGAQTRHCDHEGCSKQFVRRGKCNIHGQSERPQMVWGQCSKCPTFSNTMQKVGGDLVCVCYPCMSHSGKGVQCKARGCIKYVHPTKGEKRELQCVFHHFMAFKRCIHGDCIHRSDHYPQSKRLPPDTERDGQRMFCRSRKIHQVWKHQHPPRPAAQPSSQCCRTSHRNF